MTVQNNIKSSLHQLIDEINDDKVLEAYYGILKNITALHNQQIVGYQPNGDAITREEFEEEVMKAQQRVASGDYIKHDDLMEQMKDW